MFHLYWGDIFFWDFWAPKRFGPFIQQFNSNLHQKSSTCKMNLIPPMKDSHRIVLSFMYMKSRQKLFPDEHKKDGCEKY